MLEDETPATITSIGCLNTYSFTNNGRFIFYYEDTARNSTTIVIADWISIEAPTANGNNAVVAYS